MLEALKQQIEDIDSGSTDNLPFGYGHAIGMIAQVGQQEVLSGEGTEEAQIATMRAKATEEIIKYGSKILEFLRPELKVLIQPENLEQLERKHEQYQKERAIYNSNRGV